MESPQSPNVEMSENKGVVGLTNIGNTCYGNAVLQAVRHQVDLTIFFLQNQHDPLLKKKPQSEKTTLASNYGKLLKSLWTGETGCIQTREFWGAMIPAAIKVGFEQFRIPMAHDAHEFLVFLLDQLHEAMAEEVTMTIKASPASENYSALTAWKQSFEKSYSPLVELMFGLQRKCVKCESCSKESITWETMNIVKGSVPKKQDVVQDKVIHLLDILKEDQKDESIEEYHCEACGVSDKKKRTKAIVTRTLWRLGNCVILVLKRNESNGRKIHTKVQIPLEVQFHDLFHASSHEPSSTDMYELFSAVYHHGSSGGGHYTAEAKHPVTGKWAHYDDESGRVIEAPTLDENTYIVMYRRKV
jgi:ubiquitin C-terminal hydrolase